MSTECDHKFEYLRQEKRNIGYERNPTWQVLDVYFCSRCLKYKNIAIEEYRPSSQSFYEKCVEWRGQKEVR